MATKVEHDFERWEFTADELSAARQISPEHRMYLKTLLADVCAEKLRFRLDPYKPLEFTQQEAYARGQMDLLEMLLSEDQVARPKNAVQSQPQGN